MRDTQKRPVLTTARWYTKTAIYRNDDLVGFVDSDRAIERLMADILGFDFDHAGDVPTQNFSKWFDEGASGWWSPPQSLEVLKSQFRAWKIDETNNKIDGLERQIGQARQSLQELLAMPKGKS